MSTARFSARVQAAQTVYLDTMERCWEQVLAGEITEAEYWRVSEGAPRAKCRAAVDAATAEYDAARRAVPRLPWWRWAVKP